LKALLGFYELRNLFLGHAYHFSSIAHVCETYTQVLVKSKSVEGLHHKI